jgi:hypothetical protein
LQPHNIKPISKDSTLAAGFEIKTSSMQQCHTTKSTVYGNMRISDNMRISEEVATTTNMTVIVLSRFVRDLESIFVAPIVPELRLRRLKMIVMLKRKRNPSGIMTSAMALMTSNPKMYQSKKAGRIH